MSAIYKGVWDTLKMMLLTKYLKKWKCIGRISWKSLVLIWFNILYRITYKQIDVRDAPLDFKGGGAGSLGQDKFFFFPPAWQGKFFLFSVPNGASFFFFLALDGASFFFFFFFFLIKFVFNTHFQMKLR